MPRIRDHPCITSGKDWMGGFKKWQCLLTFRTVYKYADFTPLGGGWFRKGPKMCWRNTYMDGPLLNFIYAEKATKFQEVSLLLVRTLLSNFKTKREISSNLCGLLRKPQIYNKRRNPMKSCLKTLVWKLNGQPETTILENI